MHQIDIQTWPRREHFKVFSAFDHPHFSLCANVDLTAFYPVVKQRGISFTVATVYILARAANAIPEFRYGLPIADSREKLYAAYGKCNLPDEAPVKGNLWVLCASYAHNPMILLLELIWTRLTYSKRLSSSVCGLDLQVEILRPLLLAKAIEQNGQVGWYYEHFILSQPVLDRIPAIANWEPTELTLGQFIVLMHLIIQENAGMAGMDINTPAMLEELQENSFSAIECIAYLRQAGLVSLEGNTLRLLTRQCGIACLPDGRVVAGENASLCFSNWVMNYMKIHRSRDNQKARPTLHAPDQAKRGFYL